MLYFPNITNSNFQEKWLIMLMKFKQQHNMYFAVSLTVDIIIYIKVFLPSLWAHFLPHCASITSLSLSPSWGKVIY